MTEPSTPADQGQPAQTLQLPTVLMQDPAMRDFAEAISALLTPYYRALDPHTGLARLLDAWRTDPAWLPWLGQIAHAPNLWDWDEVAQRAAVHSATALAAVRGTRTGLLQEAALLGWELSVWDPGWTTNLSSAPAHETARLPLTVALAWPSADSINLPGVRDQLSAIVRNNCPASTPWTVLVGEGFTPTSALTLPPPARDPSTAPTVFFYGPATGGDHTVGYDLATCRPIPGPSPLSARWKTGDTSSGKPTGPINSLADFAVQGRIHGAAYWPNDHCFYLVSQDKAAVWDSSAKAFTQLLGLDTLFPGLTAAVRETKKEQGRPLTDDILTVLSGPRKDLYGLHVFSGEYVYHYTAPKTPLAKKRKISELYNSGLPPAFTRDLDAVATHPDRPEIHYLIAGPQCAEISGFTYIATHLIRDLWPGLPVRTLSTEIGGGSLTVPQQSFVGKELVVSYYTRGRSAGAQISLYAGPKVGHDDRKSLTGALDHQQASDLSGTVTFPGDKVAIPGVHSVYYGDPAFDIWLSDPAEFTALLTADQLAKGALQPPANPTSGTSLAFTGKTQKAWLQHATIAVQPGSKQRAADQKPAPHALSANIEAITADDNGNLKASVPSGLPPGDWIAYLLARGGAAWLAKPATFTVTLPADQYGTLELKSARQDATAQLPEKNSATFSVAFSKSSAQHRRDGKIRIYAGQNHSQTPDTVPSAEPVQAIALDISGDTAEAATAAPLEAGGYTAYWTAGESNAWQAKPLYFSVSTTTLGTLVRRSNWLALAAQIEYSTNNKQNDAIMAFFDAAEDLSPKLNTAPETWKAAHFVRLSASSGTMEATLEQLKEPGEYTVHLTDSSGRDMAKPVAHTTKIPDSSVGKLEIAGDSKRTEKDSKVYALSAEIKATLTTPYPSKRNTIIVYPGSQAEVGSTYPRRLGKHWTQDAKSPTTAAILPDAQVKYTPGLYSICAFAKDSYAWLAAPVTVLLEPEHNENNKISIKDLPSSKEVRRGATVIVEYTTEYGTKDGYDPKDNKIQIVDKGGAPQSSESATESRGSKTLSTAKLTPGTYTVELTGKDNSRLADPVEFKVTARQMTLHLVDATKDSWKITGKALVGCTASTPAPEQAGGAKADISAIVYTQDGTTADGTMKGQALCSPTQKPDKTLTVQWEIDSVGKVTFTAPAAPPLSASFATTNTPTTAKPSLETTAGQDFFAYLSNTAHRTLTTTWRNNLPGELTLVKDSVTVTNTAAFSPPQTIPSNGDANFTLTTIESYRDSSGSLTYQTPATEQPQGNITIKWESPAEGKPTLTITVPDGATVEHDETQWQEQQPPKKT